MKAVVLLLCATVAIQGRPNDPVKKIHEECQANPETHLNDDVFKAIHNNEAYDRNLVGAHMLCMSTKLGTQNQDGSVNRDKVKKALGYEIKDEAKLEELTNKCAVEASSPGETAIQLSKCIRDNMPNYGRHNHGHPHGHEHHHGHKHDSSSEED